TPTGSAPSGGPTSRRWSGGCGPRWGWRQRPPPVMARFARRMPLGGQGRAKWPWTLAPPISRLARVAAWGATAAKGARDMAAEVSEVQALDARGLSLAAAGGPGPGSFARVLRGYRLRA